MAKKNKRANKAKDKKDQEQTDPNKSSNKNNGSEYQNKQELKNHPPGLTSNQNEEDRKTAAISYANLQTIIDLTKDDSEVDSDVEWFKKKASKSPKKKNRKNIRLHLARNQK